MSNKKETNRKRFYSLDSLRGIGAFAVVWGHLGGNAGMKYAVVLDFFFVLSGFVIAHSYFWNPKTSYKDFFLIRLARMYPLHFITLLLMIIYEAIVQPANMATSEEILIHVLFIQNMGLGPDELKLNIPSWSISPEFWINIVIYALLLLFLRISFIKEYSRLIIILSSLIFSVLGYLFLALYSGSLDVYEVGHYGFLNLGLLRCTSGFLWGLFIYAIYDKYMLSWKPFKNSFIPFIIVSAYIVFAYVPFEATLWDFICPPFFGLMILYLAKDYSTFSTKLGKLSYFGDISFSIYLLHTPLIIFSWHFDYLGLSDEIMRTIIITLTFLSSVICYRYYEIPVYKYLRTRIMTKRMPNTLKTNPKQFSSE